ncbi:MAG: class II aldolase/adducin family protein [Paracoccaceae bacterium]|nr:class II aldolase/adducin family protein [Paracoccaceae bacterium]
MLTTERDMRTAIVAACQHMNDVGINQGISGNISVRFENRMLITPSAVPYDRMEADMIVSIPMKDFPGAWVGPLKPSTEWRMHLKLLQSHRDAGAVLHAHPVFCTALAMARKPIPSCHYMIAAFGGCDVRCAGYATYGSEELSDFAVEAMQDRTACLLANHGMVVTGTTLEQALWRAKELETIAKQYVISLSIGGPVLLSGAEIDETLSGFTSYGVSDSNNR